PCTQKAPSSTLFPYTTLFRSYPGDKFGFGGREARGMMMDWRQMAGRNRYLARGMKVDFEQGIRCYPGRVLTVRMTDDEFAQSDRSEEHTSELQSRFDLVCRLL